MKETTSVTIRYNNRILMREVIEIYSLTKKHNGNVTFCHDQHAVSGLQLSKLVTFFLTMKKGSDILLVVEGKRNYLYLNKVKCIFGYGKSRNQISKSITLQQPLQL